MLEDHRGWVIQNKFSGWTKFRLHCSSTSKRIVYFKMAATEVVRLGTVLCVVVSWRNAEELLRKRAFVDSEVHGIQTPGRNECACLKQNNFGTLMSCRPAVQFFLFYCLSSSAYIVQIVLILMFTSSAVSSGKFSFCECIFTSCFVYSMLTFCVPQALAILHKI